MPRVSYAFFAFAALCGLIGTIWGSRMGETGDHSTFAAHAHLNLLGWLGMAVMGGFYALTAGRVPGWLAWTNFALAAIGATSLAVAMVYIFAAGDDRFVPLVIVGSVGPILAMVSFLGAVLVAWRRNEVR